MSKTLFLTLFGLAATLPAFGDVVYTSSAAFTAAVAGYSNVVTETYSSGFTDGQDISSGSTFDGITYSNFTGGYTYADITNQYNSFSGLSLGADNTVQFSNPAQTYFTGVEGITLTFSGPVNAVGVFYNVTANTGSYGFTTSTSSNASTGSATYDTSTFVFAGLVSNTPFSSVTLFGAGSYNVPEIEAFTLTPEPTSYLALGIGLAAFAFVRHFQHPKTRHS